MSNSSEVTERDYAAFNTGDTQQIRALPVSAFSGVRGDQSSRVTTAWTLAEWTRQARA